MKEIQLEDLCHRAVEGFDRSRLRTFKVKSQEELNSFVEVARETKLRFYPASAGKNWGYGSHLPVEDDSVVLDLSGLNRILKIDEENGIAFIEPGVTQAQLADELNRLNSNFYLDVTGSGAQTSVIGNALERGIAYKNLRVNTFTDFEVLLMNGKRMKTGFGDFNRPELFGLYPHGIGPSLQGLFFQSSFGVVTKGCIKLHRRQESNETVSVSIAQKDLPKLIELSKQMLQEGLLEGIPHIGNRERIYSTAKPLIELELERKLSAEEDSALKFDLLSDWMVSFFVSGPKSLVRERVKLIQRRLNGLGKVRSSDLDSAGLKGRLKNLTTEVFANPFQKAVLKAVKDLSRLNLGEPSNVGIQLLMKNGEVSESREGFLLCTPLAPLSGESGEELLETLEKRAKEFPGVRTGVTLNIITDRVLEAVITLHYNKDKSAAKAHQFLKLLGKDFWDQGFYPYRVSIEQMEDLNLGDHPKADLINAIKAHVDPDGLLAPGKYI